MFLQYFTSHSICSTAGSVFFLPMSSFSTLQLSKSDEDAIRKLHKAVRATRYDDPVDQDAFLTASAHTVLQFRPFLVSFAQLPDIGVTVFAIRNQMQVNQPRLGGSPNKLFATLQDFAGEIVRRRQLLRDRKRAQTERVRAAEGVAARAERRAALEYAEQLNQRVVSPADDAVAIPSSGESTDVDEPLTPVENTRGPAPAINPNAAVPSSSQALLSPLSNFEGLMIKLRMGGPPTVPLASPLSPPRSLPDLVPSVLPLSVFNLRASGHGHPQPEKTVPQFVRGRALTRNPPNSPRSETSLRRSDIALLVPRPVAPSHCRLQASYVDDSPVFKPRFTGSRVRKNKYVGNSNPSRKPSHPNRKPFPRVPKRCYYCASANHLAAICLMHEID
ncbi:hypothetical protein K438DRAFT_1117957 [Mycena galopus ATCC 62051]|nr:hypothetical protein K438DRAFT_1117957 [Mycena galopus ATCC 62051]